jgi:hypothetical protein
MPLTPILLLLGLITAGPIVQPAPAPSLQSFISSLQQAVARNDRSAVAAMVRYPLDVRAGALQIPVADAAAFVKLYDSLITPGIKGVIARASKAQKPGAAGNKADLEGAITVATVGGAFKITSLNASAAAPQSGSPGAAVARQLTFKVGTPTQVSGTLVPGGTDLYEFHGEPGVFLDVRLSGVPGRSVLLRIVDSKSGAPVDARADAGTRVWTGRLSAASQYRIEVVRQPDTGSEPLIYTMAVGLK